MREEFERERDKSSSITMVQESQSTKMGCKVEVEPLSRFMEESTVDDMPI